MKTTAKQVSLSDEKIESFSPAYQKVYDKVQGIINGAKSSEVDLMLSVNEDEPDNFELYYKLANKTHGSKIELQQSITPKFQKNDYFWYIKNGPEGKAAAHRNKSFQDSIAEGFSVLFKKYIEFLTDEGVAPKIIKMLEAKKTEIVESVLKIK